jgi:hypothetical protein
MSSFGDAEPADAYDAGDPPTIRLDVLDRIATALEQGSAERRQERLSDALRLVANLRAELGRNRRLDALRARLEAL